MSTYPWIPTAQSNAGEAGVMVVEPMLRDEQAVCIWGARERGRRCLTEQGVFQQWAGGGAEASEGSEDK